MLAHPGNRVTLDHLVQLEAQEYKAQLALLVLLVRQEIKGLKVPLEMQDSLASLERLEVRDRLVAQEPLDLLEPVVGQDSLEPRVQLVILELLVARAQVEHRAIPDKQDLLVLVEATELLDRLERLDQKDK